MKKIIAIVVAALLLQGAILGGGYYYLESREYEPHPDISLLKDVERKASTYDESFDEDANTSFDVDNDFSMVVLHEDDETIDVMGSVVLEEEEEEEKYFWLIEYSYDQPLLRSGTRIYLETIMFITPEGVEDYEAWGQGYEDDDYYLFDGSPEEFKDRLKAMTPRDFQTWLTGGS